MNKQDRKELQTIIDKLYCLQGSGQEKYDNAPENLQDTEKVEKFQENADTLDEAIGTLEELLEF